MGSPTIYENGAGGTSGDELATFNNIRTSGLIWYVSSATGTDAVAPAGRDRIKPLRTLSQAVTNASVGDIIVLLSGHSETLTAGQTISKAGLRIVSEGAAGTANAARFTCNGSILMFDITAAGVTLGGIYFAASTVAPTTARVRINSAAVTLRGCYFECGTLDTVTSVSYVTGAGQCLIKSCTFVSTSTSTASQPIQPVTVVNTMSDLTLDTVTFNGGLSGWSSRTAFQANAAVTRCVATNIDLLNDSDVNMVTGSVYTWSIRNKSGSAVVILDA